MTYPSGDASPGGPGERLGYPDVPAPSQSPRSVDTPCPPANGRADRHDARGAFETLFHAEFPLMFRLAVLLGAADPENIAQEAFARLHERWADLTDRGRAGGYLRTTVVNLCRSAARHHAVVSRHDSAQAPPESAPSAETLALQSVSD